MDYKHIIKEKSIRVSYYYIVSFITKDGCKFREAFLSHEDALVEIVKLVHDVNVKEVNYKLDLF